MNLLIFGAGGFIGRHFTKVLAKYKYKHFLVYRSQKFSVKKNMVKKKKVGLKKIFFLRYFFF